jgi:putative endonuclease
LAGRIVVRPAESVRFMPPEKSAEFKAWSVYIARCANGAFYTGITNRLKDRIAAHNSGKGGKYTASFGPVQLVWFRKRKDRSSASILEARIKKLTRAKKIELIKKVKI